MQTLNRNTPAHIEALRSRGKREVGAASMKEALEQLLGQERVTLYAPLCDYTSFHIGGPADLLLRPADSDGLISCIRLLRAADIPWFILGNGTNLLVKDGGFRGAAIQLGPDFMGVRQADTDSNECDSELRIDGEQHLIITQGSCELVANAGELLSAVAARAARRGFSGMAFASGIPGSVGGAVYMNAGAYGGEMSHIVKELLAYDIVNDKLVMVKNEEMGFRYRDSTFRSKNYVILAACFALSPGNPEEIDEKMTEYRRRRSETQPLTLPSAGSFFKRPAGAYAAKLIDDAQLKGRAVGAAQVSGKHAGFIVNTGGATAKDVLSLMDIVIDTVRERSGFLLEPEPEIIGEE